MTRAGVGFARMESREKCEQIIQIFNGTQLQGAKEPLLVKFADGGSKKKNPFKSPDPNARTWRDGAEGIPVTYDPNMQQNGIGVNVGAHIGMPYGRFRNAPGWGVCCARLPVECLAYMMTQPIQQVDDQQYVQMQAQHHECVGACRTRRTRSSPVQPRGVVHDHVQREPGDGRPVRHDAAADHATDWIVVHQPDVPVLRADAVDHPHDADGRLGAGQHGGLPGRGAYTTQYQHAPK
ncbi:hypothetical protein quinque_004912 [Culex quinquefasciatus]